MLASQLLKSCLRRWYFILAGLLVTAGLTWFAYTSTPTTYQIQATAVLLPGATTVPEEGNGFLYLGGLTPALEVLIRSVNSDATAEEVLGEAFDDDDAAAEYTVERDFEASGPIMLVTATGASSREARDILESVIAIVPVRLSELQADVDVPDGSQMTLLTLSVDDRVEVLTNDRTRILLGVAAAGLGVTVLGTGFIDGLLLSARRRRADKAPRYRRSAAEQDGTEPDGTEPDGTEPEGTADEPEAADEPEVEPAADPVREPAATLAESQPSSQPR